MFDSSALVQYFEAHKDLPHKSKYHRETYMEHCMLVIYEMSKKTEESALLIAACLHDIAKPRTQGFNKIGEPCFYDHEMVTDEELAEFLSVDDSRFRYVKALIWCHMTPYKVQTANDYDATLRKSCQKTLRKAGIDVEVDDDFVRDLMLLHECDAGGSIRPGEDMSDMDRRCEQVYLSLSNL